MFNLYDAKGKEKFGERLKEARKHKGYTQEELAELLGVRRASISDWEKGNKIPNTEHLPALCTELEIDLGYLLDFYGEYNSNIHAITSITGLSKESAEKLIILSDWLTRILDNMIKEPEFINMMNDIGDFCVPSRYLALEEGKAIKGTTASEAIKHITNSKNIHKFNAYTSFLKIIESVSDEYMDEYKDAIQNPINVFHLGD